MKIRVKKALNLNKNYKEHLYVVLGKDNLTGKQRKKFISTGIFFKGNNKRKAEDKIRYIVGEFKKQDIKLGRDVLFTVYIKDWFLNLKYSIESFILECI